MQRKQKTEPLLERIKKKKQKTFLSARVLLSNFCMALFQMSLIIAMINFAEQAKPLKYSFTSFTQGQSFILQITNVNSRGFLQVKSCFFLLAKTICLAK